MIIPKKFLFSNPDKAAVRISPNGKYISYLSNYKNILNIFIIESENLKNKKQITFEIKRSILKYFWCFDSENIIFEKDFDGDENTQLFKINIYELKTKSLTPYEKVKVILYEYNENFPQKMIVGINDRDKQMHDIYMLNIKTGKRKLLLKNTKYCNFDFDNKYNLRFAYEINQDGSRNIYKCENNKFILYDKIPFEDIDTTFLIGFDKKCEKIYWVDSRNRNTNALIEEYKNKKIILAQNKKTDIDRIIINPLNYEIDAVSFNFLKTKWKILNENFKKDFEIINSKNGNISINSSDKKNEKWIFTIEEDNKPLKYYIYKNKKVKFLFFNKKKLVKYKFQKTKPILIKSRDGLNLVSYLTKPNSKPPYPTIILVHGGPNCRDEWGFDLEHKWLANRGYAVLSVNYRGSTGFGKKFIRAGDLEWGRKMQDDLIDGAKYLIKKNISKKDYICIMGGSYGGYAALAGLTFTPDFFCCGISIVGISNLETHFNSIPEYWKPEIADFKKTIGNPDTKEGIKILKERSPINNVEKIKKPLLIQHGLNDPRCSIKESEQIVEKMKKRNIPFFYMKFLNEGHGFLNIKNIFSAQNAIEIFLHIFMKGKLEKIKIPKNNNLKMEIYDKRISSFFK